MFTELQISMIRLPHSLHLGNQSASSLLAVKFLENLLAFVYIQYKN